MSDYKVLIGLVVLILLFLAMRSAKRKPIEVIEGGIYSAIIGREKTGENIYGVIKVLRYENHAVHSRVYKNRFKKRPTTIDPSILSLGTIHDKDGQGIGHAPLSGRMFTGMLPVLMMRSEVSAQELDGYNAWKEAKGGVFELGR